MNSSHMAFDLDHKIFKRAPKYKDFAQTRVYCPVCKLDMWEDGARIHISNTAKHEVFNRELKKLVKENAKTPHFDFWLEHTMPFRGITKRMWKV